MLIKFILDGILPILFLVSVYIAIGTIIARIYYWYGDLDGDDEYDKFLPVLIFMWPILIVISIFTKITDYIIKKIKNF